MLRKGSLFPNVRVPPSLKLRRTGLSLASPRAFPPPNKAGSLSWDSPARVTRLNYHCWEQVNSYYASFITNIY